MDSFVCLLSYLPTVFPLWSSSRFGFMGSRDVTGQIGIAPRCPPPSPWTSRSNLCPFALLSLCYVFAVLFVAYLCWFIFGVWWTASCQADQFRCTVSGSCIPAAQKCDGIVDCPDREDESNCPTPPPPGFCFVCLFCLITRFLNLALLLFFFFVILVSFSDSSFIFSFRKKKQTNKQFARSISSAAEMAPVSTPGDDVTSIPIVPTLPTRNFVVR